MKEIQILDCTNLIEREGWDCAACGHRHTCRTPESPHMSWTERKARMLAEKEAIVPDALRVIEVLRSQARGGLGYVQDVDELADAIEDELIPPEQWEDPARDTLAELSKYAAEPLAASSSPAWEPKLRALIVEWRKSRDTEAPVVWLGRDRCADELEALLPPPPKDQP